ncbi:DUF6020 family protein [Collinsella sp. D33t1_170424_A12]|uniref:DUF6020 family protein n=1 Tax=Collinsella sp. D33t1_170424_A12 TaxID=2787135 RepID=UPI00189BCFAA|nr:DUF6020 family protein [Collinsella sp. D33t1_170424_A12]
MDTPQQPSRIIRGCNRVRGYAGYLLVLAALSLLCTMAESTNAAFSFDEGAVRFGAYLAAFTVVFLGCEHLAARVPSRNAGALSRVRIPHILAFTAIIFICWMPLLDTLYPGVTFSDTSSQLCQFFGNPPEFGPYCIVPNSAFSDHHPILDTLIMGSLVKIGMEHGSANDGFMLLVIVQSVLLALSISRTICHVAVRFSWRLPSLAIAIAFFSLFPVFPFMAASPVKDTLFIIVFLAFLVEFSRIALSDSPRLPWLVGLFCCTALLALTKRTGLYVAALCLLGALVLKRALWKQLLACMAPAIVLAAVVFPAVVFPLLDVSPGSKNEMLGFFYQQTARYVREYPKEVAPDEREVIDRLLNYETLAKRYRKDIVDMVNHGKGVDIDPSTEMVRAYSQVFAAQFLRHPENNVQAILDLESGWFDLSLRYQVAVNYGMADTPENGVPDISRPESMRARAEDAVESLNRTATDRLLGPLFTPALYTTLIPAFCLLLSLRTRRLTKERLVALLPVLASLPLLWVSPVSDASSNLEALRYTLPFLYTAPFTLAFALGRINENADGPHDQSIREHVEEAVDSEPVANPPSVTSA